MKLDLGNKQMTQMLLQRSTYIIQVIPSLKLTAKAPEHRPFAPKGNDPLPTIHFQGRAVSFREGIYTFLTSPSHKK